MQVEVKPIDLSSAKEEKESAEVMLREVGGIVICDQESYNFGAEILQKIKGRLKWLEDTRKTLKEPILLAGRQIDDFFRIPIATYGRAEAQVKVLMIAYGQQEEEKRRKEEEKLRREAEKKRVELEAKAEKAREEGKEDKAEKYEEKANNVIEPVLAPTIEKLKGISYKELWRAEVVDFEKLPNAYKLPDMPKLNKIAQATKGLVEIPGVKFRSERILTSRSENNEQIRPSASSAGRAN